MTLLPTLTRAFANVLVGVIFCCGSEANGFQEVVMEETMCQDGSRRLRPSNTYKPQTWMWLNAKQVESLVKAIEEGGLLLVALLLHTKGDYQGPAAQRGEQRD